MFKWFRSLVSFWVNRVRFKSIYLFKLFSAHGAHLQLDPVLVEQHCMGIRGSVPSTTAVVHPTIKENSHVCSM